MTHSSRIYVAGHRGMVGSAIVRRLQAGGCANILTRTHAEPDLLDQHAVCDCLAGAKPDHIFIAAAKVGGIHANNTYPAEFIRDNLAIQTNLIHAAWKNKTSSACCSWAPVASTPGWRRSR